MGGTGGTRTAIHQGDARVWGDVSEDRLTSAPDTIKSPLNIPSENDRASAGEAIFSASRARREFPAPSGTLGKRITRAFAFRSRRREFRRDPDIWPGGCGGRDAGEDDEQAPHTGKN